MNLTRNMIPSVEKEEANTKELVAIVIPTFNESENIPTLVDCIFSLNIPNTPIIVIDDGSPDGTGDVVKQLEKTLNGRIELIQCPKKMGLGPAYVAGFLRALERNATYTPSNGRRFVPQPDMHTCFVGKTW